MDKMEPIKWDIVIYFLIFAHIIPWTIYKNIIDPRYPPYLRYRTMRKILISSLFPYFCPYYPLDNL